MNAATTLDDLVRAGPDIWTTCNAERLASALKASGPLGALHLRRFCLAVESWWKEEGTPGDQRLSRHQWIDDVADPFLQSLKDEDVAHLASTLATFEEQLDFIITLANRDSGRFQLQPALKNLTTRFGAEVSSIPCAPADIDSWSRRWRALLSLWGNVGRGSETLAAVFDVPKWLLVAGLETLGQIETYDNFHKELAWALAFAKNPELPAAIAEVLIGARPLRLGEQLSILAKAACNTGGVPPPQGVPSPREARRVLTGIEVALTTAGVVEIRDTFRQFVQSWRQHDDDLQSLIRAYLNTVPSNHEEVFDFLTRYGTRERRRALSDWGGASVTTWMSGSMRSRSIHYKGDKSLGLPSPDFDVAPVFKTVSVQAVVRLVHEQPQSEFALEYLARFSQHPQFEMIASRIVSDPDCVGRWESAIGTWAVVVWDGVDWLARRSAAFKQYWARLQPILLPRLPTQYLGRERLHHLPEPLERQARDMIASRLISTGDLGELEALAKEAWEFGRDERQNMLAKLDAGRFALPEDADSEEVDSWVYRMAQLVRDAPELAERILQRMVPAQAGLLVRTHPAFGLREHDDASWLRSRLVLKARLIFRWASSEADDARAALAADLERDFVMFFWTGFSGPAWIGDDFKQPPTAGETWLDLVADVGPEGLWRSYVHGLLTHAFAEHGRHYDQAFEVIASWVARWLERKRLLAPEELWAAVERRMEVAVAKGDLEAAATLACLSLPGAPERLRQFRERAVTCLGAATRALGHSLYTGALGRFRTLLAKEAPDLLEQLQGST
jgi:hypothetical protein